MINPKIINSSIKYGLTKPLFGNSTEGERTHLSQTLRFFVRKSSSFIHSDFSDTIGDEGERSPNNAGQQSGHRTKPSPFWGWLFDCRNFLLKKPFREALSFDRNLMKRLVRWDASRSPFGNARNLSHSSHPFLGHIRFTSNYTFI